MNLRRPSSLWALLAVCTLGVPALAQDADAKSGGFGGLSPNLIGMVPYVLIFGVMYAMLIRPESKRRKAQDSMQTSLKKNDEVLTQSGFIARIVQLDEKVVTLELADKVKVRMLRDRIVGPWALDAARPAGERKNAS